MDILSVVFRTVTVYVFIVLAIRLFGKKELSQLSILDLVFILLISNSVQNAMVGNNTSLLGGIVAAGSLFVVNYLLENVLYHSSRIEKLIEGTAIMLIYKGRLLRKHMELAKITQEELEAVVREHGVKSITDVDLAVLEVDGNISVLSDDFKRKTSRKRHAHKVYGVNSS